MIAAALLIIIGCGPAASDSAKTWTTREMVANARQDKNFGGLSTRMLAVSAGDPIPWRSRPFEADDVVQGEGRGLPLWPAFAEGQTATALITEIWLNHPTPWVQPVYQFLTDGQGRSDLRGIFPVGVDSTFYTPYWRAELATVPRETTPETFKSATSLLDARVPLQKYVMVVCPIVPRDVFIAVPSGAKKAARPLSGEPVDLLDHAEAWVDDKVVTYLGVGFDRQTVTEQELPIETPIYFFVKTPGSGKPSFTLPPVLPNQPARHSLHRRYEVMLPAGAGVFVSAQKPELATLLKREGAPVPEVDSAITEAIAGPYQLRVATNPTCFLKAADFPSACRWLDSQTALESTIGQDVRVRTEVLMTVSTLQLGSTP